jgi:hypothetical protein
MKLYALSVGLAAARNVNVQNVQRNLGGNFLDSLVEPEALARGFGYNYGTASSLNGLMTMVVFMAEPPSARATTVEALEFSVENFIDNFTNYGCYCWILGPNKGVIGGGQTRDQIDGTCGMLYKCYKCLNIDFGAHDGMFNYDVTLEEDDNGNRSLSCNDGPNKEACQCDKLFSERMATVVQTCNDHKSAGITDSPFCPNDAFRTESGGGTFDPFDNTAAGCLKANMEGHNPKDACCGVYPERLPFDTQNRECCRMTQVEDNGDSFTFDKIVPGNTCSDRGGKFIDPDDA